MESTPQLVRRLCDAVARDALRDPQAAAQLSAQLFDTAYSTLIGLEPEAAVEYVAPDARPVAAQAALDRMCGKLAAGSFGELADSLRARVADLRRLERAALLGSPAELLSGVPPSLALTEHDAVLAFFLGLQGTRLSVRRRQATFQGLHEAAAAAATSRAAAPLAAAPLGSGVFAELPDPHALTDVAPSTVALLPEECGCPSDPFAGAGDVQDLSSCMSSRPAWNPTAPAHAPAPPAAAWLPMPPQLLEMRGDRRRGARPPPVGLPWGLLSMGEEPGAATAFQGMREEPSDDDEAPLNGSGGWAASNRHPASGLSGGREAAPSGAAAVKVVGSSGGLWSLEEADLAREALLALQGVHSALMRLQGMLKVPAALPRPSIAGVLSRVVAAAELRGALQLFAGAHLAAGGGGAADPVLRAFAAALGEVLRQQVAALQALERDGATSWVRRVELGGQPGREFHGRGLTLLQVALHTGRLQTQLHALAALCWCLPDQQQQTEGAASVAQQQQWESFPRGAALLSYLHQARVEADSMQLTTLRLLFGAALQPYLAHLRRWAFTPGPLLREFSTRAEEAVAPCLGFLPPEEEDGRLRASVVPCDPPAFLQPIHAAFMRGGAQLRLLDTLGPSGKDLVAQLASIAEGEARSLRQAAAPALTAAAQPAAGPGLGMGAGAEVAAAGALPEAEGAGEGSWLPQCGTVGAAGEPTGDASLQLTTAQLQQAAAAVEAADAARVAAVEGWLVGLGLRREEAEQAAAAEALGRTATIRERQLRAAARQAELAAQKRSRKQELLRQQSDELAARRAQAAAQRTQQLAEERELLAQAAIKEHSAAVAELAATLQGSSLADTASGLQPSSSSGVPGQVVVPQPGDLGPPAAGAAEPAAASGTATLAAEPAAAAPAEVPAGAGPAAVAEPPPGLPAIVPRRPREQWQHVGSAPAAGPLQPALLAPHAALQPPGPQLAGDGVGLAPTVLQQEQQQQHEGSGEGAEGVGQAWPAPLSAVLETVVAQSVVSQYRAVSQACVRYFLEELRVLEHLEALRRAFFMGAGDWADAFAGALAAHADSLEPLGQHELERLLVGSLRGTCLEEDPYAARLRVRLLPGQSTISAQVAAVALPTPQRRTRPRPRAAVSVVVPPTLLEGLDCVALEYDMGWPLSAVITEDIMAGYSAVFSQLLRLRRVEQLLRGLYSPLLEQPKSTAAVLLSEDDADRAYRRLQRLRGFRHSAAQLVAAVTAYLHSRTSGTEWVALLAKLMISSEDVAVAVLSLGASATVTGLLSRMSSMLGSGSAAHRLVKLAKSLSRAGSPRSLSRQSSRSFSLSRHNSLDPAALSQPGTPPAGAGEAAAAPRAAGAGPSRLGPSRLASTVSATAAAGAPAAAPADVPSALGTLAEEAGSVAVEAGSLPSFYRPPQQQQQQPGTGRGQEEGGIADLQELLDLHRAYVRASSSDCLTFGGNPAVREAVDATLQAAIDFALRLQAAVRLGSAGRGETCWVQVLRRDASWAPLEEAMAAFNQQAQALHGLLEEAARGSRGPLFELAQQLDFSGYYSKLAGARQ